VAVEDSEGVGDGLGRVGQTGEAVGRVGTGLGLGLVADDGVAERGVGVLDVDARLFVGGDLVVAGDGVGDVVVG